jgi:hypothetical protein
MKTAKEQSAFLIDLLKNAFIETSFQNKKQGVDKNIRFEEEFNREKELLTITVFSKEAGHKEIAIQEFKYLINKEHSKYEQILNAYLNFFNYLMGISVITMDSIARQLAVDAELQKEAKIITKL